MNSATETTVLLARHGETNLNAVGEKIQGGDSNGPQNQLNEKGKEQAKKLGMMLAQKFSNIPAFYSSDLDRAYDTACIVKDCYPDSQSEVVKIPNFKEMRHASHENTPRKLWNKYAAAYFKVQEEKALAEKTVLDRDFKWKTTPFTGEETVQELFNRMNEGMLQVANENPGKTVFVCSHGAATSTLRIGCTTPREDILKHYIEISAIANCAIAVFKVDPKAIDSEDRLKFVEVINLE